MFNVQIFCIFWSTVHKRDFVFLTTGEETTPAECGAQDVQSESAIDPEVSGQIWGSEQGQVYVLRSIAVSKLYLRWYHDLHKRHKRDIYIHN